MTNLDNLGKLPRGCAKTTSAVNCSGEIPVNPELTARLQALNSINAQELGLLNTIASNEEAYTPAASNGKSGSGFGRA